MIAWAKQAIATTKPESIDLPLDPMAPPYAPPSVAALLTAEAPLHPKA
jgi:hypothetical protein